MVRILHSKKFLMNQFLALSYFILLINSSNITLSQTPNYLTKLGASENQTGITIQLDNSGSLFATGIYTGYIDLDPGPGVFGNGTSWTEANVFVTKLSAAGIFEWGAHIGSSTGNESIKESVLDHEGNLYITGNYNLSCDFNFQSGTSILTSNGWNNVFILKISSSGNFVWAKKIGGPGDDHPRKIVIDQDENIYITGLFEDSCDFDPGPLDNYTHSQGSFDGFICKLDSAGNYLWHKTYGSTSNDENDGVTLDTDGSVYLSGRLNDSIKVNPYSSAYLYEIDGSGYLVKLTSSGDFVWSKQFPSVYEVLCDTITQEIIITGGFSESVDFDPSFGIDLIAHTDHGQFFIQKIDTSGDYLWTNSFGPLPGSITYLSNLSVDTNSNIFICGSFTDSINLNPQSNLFTTQPNGLLDMYYLELNPQGDFILGDNIGGSNNDWLYDIFAYNDQIFLTGSFRNTVDFDLSTTTSNLTATAADAFIVSYDICQEPVDISYTENLGTYIANLGGAEYKWINCDTGLPILGETSQTFTPTVDGNYALEVNSFGCVSTSSCFVYEFCNTLNMNWIESGSSYTANLSGATYQWINCNTGAALTGETSQTFIPSIDGSYAFAVEYLGCLDTSNCIDVFGLSTENSEAPRLFCSPNPTDGKFQIQLSNTPISQVQIRDTSGKIVAEHKTEDENGLLLNLNLSSGIYFLSVISSDLNVYITKLVVN